MTKTRDVVADDHPVVRAGIVALLGTTDDLDVVGEATTGLEAVELALELEPDVVLMDLRMPGINGDEATAQILATKPEIRVLVLTTYESDDSILTAIEAGATGYLLKAAPQEELLAGIRATHRRPAGQPGAETGRAVAQRTREGSAAPRRTRAQQPSHREGTLPLRSNSENTPAARVRETRGERPDAGGDTRHGVGAALSRS